MMDSPHDPSAPAGEVVNCRCYVELLYAGDTRPDGTTVEDPRVQAASAVEAPENAPEPPALTGKAGRVADAAQQHGVSEAQVKGHLADVPIVKAQIRREAEQAMAESIGWLDSFDGMKLARPGRVGARSAEYDFLEQVGPKERARLSSWWTDSELARPDVRLAEAQALGIVSDSMSVDQFTEEWLHHTRVVDTGASLRAGRWPSAERMGGLDPATLAPDLASQGIDIQRVIMASSVEDAAGYLAEQTVAQVGEDAYRALAPDSIRLGPAPWRMSYQSWSAEVMDLEYDIEQGTATATQVARHDELVPSILDSGQDFEMLYAEVIETARMAELDVSSWATIPWAE